MKILCGTDFSSCAGEAASVAAWLAAKTKGDVELVHVNEPGGSAAKEAEGRLKTEAARLEQLGTRVRAKVLSGSAHMALAEQATQSGVELIVVSSLGCITPVRFLVGSVAERTAQTATVPTLVVRDEGPFKRWLEGGRRLRLLIGYDFSATADAALRWAAELSRVAACQVTVAYVSWPPNEVWRFGMGESFSMGANPPAFRDILAGDLKERCRGLFNRARVRVVVKTVWGGADVELLDLAKEQEADLIVVGTRQQRGLKRFYLGSVSREVLYHAPVSVACVPESGAPTRGLAGARPFRRVLVPTDFSRFGNGAIPYAYGALHRGGEVGLVHVTVDSASKNAAVHERLAGRLRHLIPGEAVGRGIETRVEVVEHRSPAVAIAQAAERFRADLICMGSQGRTGLTKTLLGSVTREVLARSRRPVMVIRPPDR